jgi:hypothetical protein
VIVLSGVLRLCGYLIQSRSELSVPRVVGSVQDATVRAKDLPMTPHDEFSTESFFRYSAECSRMAALARPMKVAEPRNAAVADLLLHCAQWLKSQRFAARGIAFRSGAGLVHQ